MKNIIVNIGILFFQIAITFTLLLVVYMLLAIMDSDFGIEGLLILTFVQPIIGLLLTIGVIVGSFFVGLPIRLNENIQAWWTTNNIAVIGIILGFALMLISNMDFLQETVEYNEEGVVLKKNIPQAYMLYSGWCILGFMCLHLFPSEKLRMKMMHFFNSIV